MFLNKNSECLKILLAGYHRSFHDKNFSHNFCFPLLVLSISVASTISFFCYTHISLRSDGTSITSFLNVSCDIGALEKNRIIKSRIFRHYIYYRLSASINSLIFLNFNPLNTQPLVSFSFTLRRELLPWYQPLISCFLGGYSLFLCISDSVKLYLYCIMLMNFIQTMESKGLFQF